MTIYTPTNTPVRPPQNPGGGVQGAPDIVTRNLVTGYEWNQGNSLPHDMVDANWVSLDTMAQTGQQWPMYRGLYLKNRGLDTEGGIFVDNPYNNGGVTRFGVNYVNYRIPLEDSSFGVTLAQGDFLSHKGNLHLKDGSIKYGTKVSFVDSALDSAMTITETDIFVGKGSTANPNSSQFRIGKLGGTKVEIGSLNNILNQEVTLQVGASGAFAGTSKSGSIKAKQIQVTPPKWNLSLNSFNGSASVEALTISPEGLVTIPSLVGAGPDYDSAKITDFTSPGLVNLGTSGGSDTVIKGNLQVDGTIIGGGITVGVQSANLATSGGGLAVSQISNTGAVTMNVDVAASYEMPLASEVTSWNNLIGTAGGAAKADKLTTSRTLWGQAFDGTANVSGPLNVQGWLTNVSSVNSSSGMLRLVGAGALRIEEPTGEYRFLSGITPTAFGHLQFGNITVNRDISFQDKSGTLALMSDVDSAGIQVDEENTFTALQTFSAGATGFFLGNATSANTATNAQNLNGKVDNANNVGGTIVSRNLNGDFACNLIFGDIQGNATTASTADNSLLLNGVTSSTSANGTIVRRSSAGNFTANIITGNTFYGTFDGTVVGGVTVSTNQTITGDKTFSSILRCSNDIDFTSGNNGKIKQLTAGRSIDFLASQDGTTQLSVGAGGITVDGLIIATSMAIGENSTFNGNLTCNGATLTANQFISRGTIDFPLTADIDADIRQLAPGKLIRFLTGPNNADTQLQISDFGASFTNDVSVGGQLLGFAGASINGAVTIQSGLGAGSLAVDGDITATGDITAFFTSDKRLKDNIVPIENALDKVASLSGNTFDWNDKTDKVGSETGVIAQEVAALGLPDLVTERENGYLAVRYEKLVPLLIEAIKELKEEVEELKG